MCKKAASTKPEAIPKLLNGVDQLNANVYRHIQNFTLYNLTSPHAQALPKGHSSTFLDK